MMKKLTLVLLSLLVVGCSAPTIAESPTPEPTRDMSFIKQDQQHIKHVVQVGNFSQYDGYNLYRIYDPEAGVVCWFIAGAPGYDGKGDVGLGCMPAEETRLTFTPELKN